MKLIYGKMKLGDGHMGFVILSVFAYVWKVLQKKIKCLHGS
jgi:hypothetical protein